MIQTMYEWQKNRDFVEIKNHRYNNVVLGTKVYGALIHKTKSLHAKDITKT